MDRERTYRQFDGVRNRGGLPFASRIGIKSDRNADALCARVDEIQWVIVSDRLVDLLDDAFSTIATVSNELPLFTPGHAFEPSRLDHVPGYGRRVAGRLESAAPANIFLGGYMAYVALRFVADHEFFHAFHGHLLLVEELFSRLILPTLSDPRYAYEPDIRLALELEADRSAVTQHMIDLSSGDVPTNDAIDRLSATQRVRLVIVSIAANMALFASEDEVCGYASGTTHPRWESRLYMLLGPTLIRALILAGWNQSAVKSIQAQVIQDVGTLVELYSIFSPIADALDHDRMLVHDIENRRLEMVYQLNIMPLLVRYQFSGLSDSDLRITSVR